MKIVLVRSSDERLPRECHPHYRAKDLRDFWEWLRRERR